MMVATLDSISMKECALYHCLEVQELDWSTSAAPYGHGGHAWHPGKTVCCPA